ncbi:hypothetical protein BDR04DRAFT_137060 [Suillus decipiens]|nr:hypothetical protein BDR04DRAFT_137060 [Suillus decipiens]
MEAHTPLDAASLMTGCRRICPIDSHGEPFSEFTDPNIANQGSLNYSGMSYSTYPGYDDNYHPLNLLENQCHESACMLNDHSYHNSGVIHASSPGETQTALFVANYLHQLRLSFGTDMTLDQAIRICSGQWDTSGYYHHFLLYEYRLHYI